MAINICKCSPKRGNPLQHYRFQPLPKMHPDIEVDFGKVPFTRQVQKAIEIDIEDQDSDSYFITISDENRYHCGLFSISPTEGYHKAGTRLKLRCSYSPKMPFQTNCEQYTLRRRNFSVNITLRGESTGPILMVSSTHVKFCQDPHHKVGRAVLEIRNITGIPAEFSMDFDSKQKLFTVTPLTGVCNDLTFVVIHFNPPDVFGAYSQQLTCLVFGKDPIVINILGVYSKKQIDLKEASIIHYPLSFTEKNSYNACFRPVLYKKKTVAPVTLSTHYLDLGRAVIQEHFERESTLATKNFNLTNNLEKPIVVDWIEDDTVFSIYPKKVTVEPAERMFFRCVFCPTYDELLYNRRFTAQIHWTPANLENRPANANTIVVPLTVSINLQGHSFREGQVPLGNIECVPALIDFPPCLVGQRNYQTFKMINRISRPVTFKLMPPAQSHVRMTPMAGSVNDFMIILVHYEAGRIAKALDELWHVALNGLQETKIPLRVIGLSGIPSLVVGDHNKINLEMVQVNTVSTSVFYLQNTCNYNLDFQFVKPDNPFASIEPSQGELPMYKRIPLNIIFKHTECAPNSVKMEVQFHIQQKLHEPTGPSYDQTFVVNASSTYSELSATTLTQEFSMVEYGTLIDTYFHIYNFGPTTIFYYLNAKLGPSSSDIITLDPVHDLIHPNESTKVNLTLDCKTFGNNNFVIEYYNRCSPNASNYDDKAIELMNISYECQISKLVISEIVEHDFGPLFSKKHFWAFLQITRTNTMLQHLNPRQTESIKVELPECTIGSQHYVTIALQNITDFDTEVHLKRKKLCKCELVQKASPYRIEYALECIHRDTLSMAISDTKVNKRSTQMITIEVNYSIPGETTMAYEIHLRPERILVIYFKVYAIPEQIGRISAYSSTFYISIPTGVLSARHPPKCLFWLYNNTDYPTEIDVDQTELEEINKADKYKIFALIFDDVVIPPKSMWPLMIKFRPIEVKLYKTAALLRINGNEQKLEIEGYGLSKTANKNFFETHMPESSQCVYKFPVSVSKDMLTVSYLPTWSYTEQIIFLENVTKDKLIYYEWTSFTLPNIIKIAVADESGIIRAGKSRAVIIKIESFNESVLSAFILTCTLMDLQLMYAQKKLRTLKEIIQQEKENKFEFSDYPIKPRSVNKEFEFDMSDLVTYNISVTININIVNRSDLHIFIQEPSHCFKYFPPECRTFKQDRDLFNERITESGGALSLCETEEVHKPQCLRLDPDTVDHIFETIISDIVFNDIFQETISAIFSENPLYYTQLNLDERPYSQKQQPLEEAVLEGIKAKEIKKFFSRPTIPFLAKTFQSVIRESVHKSFGLTSPDEQEADDQAMRTTMEHLKDFCTLKECACPTDKI